MFSKKVLLIKKIFQVLNVIGYEKRLFKGKGIAPRLIIHEVRLSPQR